MLCIQCNNEPVNNKTHSLCRTCNYRRLAQENVDKLHITPCAGDCGRRVHNMKYLIVPGVVQGHGVGSTMCAGCSGKYQPEGQIKLMGDCVKCGTPMVSGTPSEGFKKHKVDGICTPCYKRLFTPGSNGKGEANGNSKLIAAHILDIRDRVAKGQPKREIARMYRINAATVRHIANRDTWAHV